MVISLKIEKNYFEIIIILAKQSKKNFIGKCSDIKICQNEGFMNENCTCICPDQISGEFCELVNTKQRKFIIKALKSNSSK